MTTGDGESVVAIITESKYKEVTPMKVDLTYEQLDMIVRALDSKAGELFNMCLKENNEQVVVEYAHRAEEYLRLRNYLGYNLH